MEAIAILMFIVAIAFFVFSIGGFDDLIVRHMEMRRIHKMRERGDYPE